MERQDSHGAELTGVRSHPDQFMTEGKQAIIFFALFYGAGKSAEVDIVAEFTSGMTWKPDRYRRQPPAIVYLTFRQSR